MDFINDRHMPIGPGPAPVIISKRAPKLSDIWFPSVGRPALFWYQQINGESIAIYHCEFDKVSGKLFWKKFIPELPKE